MFKLIGVHETLVFFEVVKNSSQTIHSYHAFILKYLFCVYTVGKQPEEIRKTFNIKNDFTPEEEEQVSKCGDKVMVSLIHT